jgi:phenylacetic acid degradation operon negative regulatory protein
VFASGEEALARIVAHSGLTAGGFIVTLFGDIAEPRGGRMATAALIEACGRVGLNPTQVRTAISRLVAGGRLEGEREGRRSQYRLTEAASAEFAAASRAIFSPRRPAGWCFVWAPDESAAALETQGARRIGPEFWMARAGVVAPGGLVFAAEDGAPAALTPALARKLWPLGACEADYTAFEALFQPLELALARGLALVGDLALTLRLLLTHRFRAAALADPGLPASALGSDWRGDAARGLFCGLYLALSREAEAAIPALFNDGERALPESTPATRARLSALGAWIEKGAASV